MKLKYYLRGLGIGIAVTSLVLGLSGRKESLTDEEIKARAAELGMVEDKLLSELKETETMTELSSEEQSVWEEVESEIASASVEEVLTEAETEINTAIEEIAVEETETEATEIEETGIEETETEETETEETGSLETEIRESETETVMETETESAALEAESEEAAAPVETIPFTIHSGETSWPIAQRIQAEGLVKDARAFDDFLCDNGYSRYLRSGSYEIPVGASEEEIAKILSRKNQ